MAPVPGFLQSTLLKTQQMISQLAMRPGLISKLIFKSKIYHTNFLIPASIV